MPALDSASPATAEKEANFNLSCSGVYLMVVGESICTVYEVRKKASSYSYRLRRATLSDRLLELFMHLGEGEAEAQVQHTRAQAG